MVQFS
jgi:uncharacterized membrane protein YjgN (DUF898 family)